MSTTNDLRKNLLKDLECLRKGGMDIKTIRAISEHAKQINTSLRYDIENKRENIKLMKATSSKKYKELNVESLKL